MGDPWLPLYLLIETTLEQEVGFHKAELEQSDDVAYFHGCSTLEFSILLQSVLDDIDGKVL